MRWESTPGDFYPRSPCGERRDGRSQRDFESLFLSTLSLRRATMLPSGEMAQSLHFYPRSPCGERLLHGIGIQSTATNFYPRSPCGERLNSIHNVLMYRKISIHALLAESDTTPPKHGRKKPKFLSTLSLRRATTKHDVQNCCWHIISIHALLAESDTFM